jgi:glutathione peroxidase
MRRTIVALVASVALMAFVVSPAGLAQGAEKVASALSYQMKSLDGKPVDLSKYQGKVVLIVNVASKCGLTPQYKGLEELHEKYSDKGLAILGFPANEFGKQEPGSDKEISEFCTKNYGVKFDMFSKVVVKGDGQCDLYKFLTSEETDPKYPGDIKWNFEKFLIDRQGNIVNRFAPTVKPDAPQLVEAVEAELAK